MVYSNIAVSMGGGDLVYGKKKKKKKKTHVVAERLEPRTSIPAVPGSSPGPAVAPLGKALYPHCLVFRRRL